MSIVAQWHYLFLSMGKNLGSNTPTSTYCKEKKVDSKLILPYKFFGSRIEQVGLLFVGLDYILWARILMEVMII